MVLSTILLVVGPPLVLVVAYYWYKKKKRKKKKAWYKSWDTYILSFVSSGWITLLIRARESLQEHGLIDEAGLNVLENIQDLSDLVVPLPIPVEIRLFILITIIIILLLIPTP